MHSTCLRRFGLRGAGLLALAALVAPLREAAAHTFCVSTAEELRQALADVSDGGAYVDEANRIYLAAGTYLTGGTVFRSEALASTAPLDIQGGWRANCGSVLRSPTGTVLDAQGTGGVLAIVRPQAVVSISRLVLQNGNAEVGAGLQVNHGVTPAAVVGLYQLLVRNNHASGHGGGMYVAGAAPVNYAPIQINSSLIADNISGGDGGGAYLVITGGGTARFGSLTVASNVAAVDGGGGLVASGDQGGYFLRAVIAWGNTPASLRFGLPSTLDWSDVDAIAPGSPLTMDQVVNADPLFADPAAGDYHLGSGTPLVRTGPPILFVPADLDGNAFPPANGRFNADIGAYQDTIFVDGNEG